MELDHALAEFVQEQRIPIFGIAHADDFDRALPGWCPKDLMPRCHSVVVFGRPFVEHSLTVDEKSHRANESWWKMNEPVFHGVAAWRGALITLFDTFGLGAANFGGYGFTSAVTFSYRLAQYEAGVGVYGRFGVCLHPEFGCSYTVGVLLTEAKLLPSDRTRLKDFSPCDNCKDCAEVCPVKAIDASRDPVDGNNLERCMRFILAMKQRYGEHTKVCARCFSVCPWGNRRTYSGE
jgi:epoxyqueuosine reductase QueG